MNDCQQILMNTLNSIRGVTVQLNHCTSHVESSDIVHAMDEALEAIAIEHGLIAGPKPLTSTKEGVCPF